MRRLTYSLNQALFRYEPDRLVQKQVLELLQHVISAKKMNVVALSQYSITVTVPFGNDADYTTLQKAGEHLAFALHKLIESGTLEIFPFVEPRQKIVLSHTLDDKVTKFTFSI